MDWRANSISFDMKLLLFIDSLGAGGAQRQLVGLANMLHEEGHEVKVCSYFDIPFFKPDLDKAGVANEIIPDAADAKRRPIAVTKYLRRQRPDWVIAYLETPSLLACLAKLMGCRFKLIVSERNTTQTVGMNERVRFALFRLADAIVPNAYAQERYLEEAHPWMKDKLRTIPNFVDLEKYRTEERHCSATPLILVAASVWNSKNVKNFILATKILKERNANFRVEWYGIVDNGMEANRIYLEECLQMIEETGIADVFSLLPKTQQIAEKYKQADYFCLPSFYEGTPNVICEAMASGLPVVCSRVCDNPIYVEDGINGHLFDPNEPADMADKLEAALRLSSDEYTEYSRSSRKRAEELLSQDRFLEQYLTILNA